MFAFSTFSDCLEKLCIHTHGHHSRWTVAETRSTTLAQFIDVIADFCLVSPRLDLFFRDVAAVDLVLAHTLIVLR